MTMYLLFMTVVPLLFRPPQLAFVSCGRICTTIYHTLKTNGLI